MTIRPGQWAAPIAAARRAMQRLLRQQRRELTVTPEFFDLPFEPVSLRTRDGVSLAAWFVPGDPSRRLMALVHHHFAQQKAAVLPWIELLHAQGVSCLAFDARGHGGSPCAPEQASFVSRLADVHAAATELSRRGARRVLGVGLSQGAAVVIAALAADPRLAGLIVDSGPALLALPPIWGMTGEMLAESPESPRGSRLCTTWMLRRMVQPRGYSWHLWRGLLQARRRPLLWLHGSDDRVIPARWVAAWFAPLALTSSHWQAYPVSGAGHAQCLQLGGAATGAAVTAFIASLLRVRA